MSIIFADDEAFVR
jgi:CheY-like chemotaxis protein